MAAVIAQDRSWPALMTRQVAAEFLGVTPRVVKRLDEEGRLKRVQGFERPVMYSAAQVRRLAEV